MPFITKMKNSHTVGQLDSQHFTLKNISNKPLIILPNPVHTSRMCIPEGVSITITVEDIVKSIRQGNNQICIVMYYLDNKGMVENTKTCKFIISYTGSIRVIIRQEFEEDTNLVAFEKLVPNTKNVIYGFHHLGRDGHPNERTNE